MFRRMYLCLLAGPLVLLTAAASTADVITLEPTDDAYLDSAAPDATWDNTGLEQLGYANGFRRPLLRFDLSSIPDSATVLSAALTLQLLGHYGGDLHPTSAWRMPGDDWLEETVTWNSYDQTGAVSVAILPPTTQDGPRVWHITIADWNYAADLLDNALTFETRWDASDQIPGSHEGDGWYKWNTYSSKEGTVTPTLRIEYVPEPPGIESVVTVNVHDGVGEVGVPVDVGASVGVDSGAVTTESRIDGITRLEITFAETLDQSVAALGAAAVTITPDPGVGIATSLADGDLTLVLDFDPPIDGVDAPDTYRLALTDAVIAADAATPGDRDFEVRALAGNVVSASGAGPQIVSALDIGLGGIRGHFTLDVSDPANAPYDVNQSGTIDALDMGCVRLTCGVFTNTAP